MTSQNSRFHSGKKGAALAVHIKGEAVTNEITGISDDGVVQLNLATKGIDSSDANHLLINYLAKILSIPASRIEIIFGENTPSKLITILDLETETVQQRILGQLKHL